MRRSAIDHLANILASNPSFSRSVLYNYGNVWAYRYDYGHGQKETVSQWDFDMRCDNAQCSVTGGGWNRHHKWKSTYGRQGRGISQVSSELVPYIQV